MFLTEIHEICLSGHVHVLNKPLFVHSPVADLEEGPGDPGFPCNFG